MEDNETRKIAEEISFRLLATRNHVDFEWLVEKLSSLKDKNTVRKTILPNLEKNYSDCGDAFDY